MKAAYIWGLWDKNSKPLKKHQENIDFNKSYFTPEVIGLDVIESWVARWENKKLQSFWEKIPHPVIKGDLGRLLHIYFTGGFYFDTDCRINKPLNLKKEDKLVLFVEKLLPNVSFLGPKEQKSPERVLRIANFAFGCTVTQHKFLKEVIEESIKRLETIISKNNKELTEEDILWCCGPDVITSVYHDSHKKYDDILLLDSTYINHFAYGSWRF
jgi:hypothetical protein|tara:strand:- start:1259 stop:1897 length:639 start_codon:yes stop_codon:yes gene_type:complete